MKTLSVKISENLNTLMLRKIESILKNHQILKDKKTHFFRNNTAYELLNAFETYRDCVLKNDVTDMQIDYVNDALIDKKYK